MKLLEAQIKNRLNKAQEKLGKAQDEVSMWEALLQIATKEQTKLT